MSSAKKIAMFIENPWALPLKVNGIHSIVKEVIGEMGILLYNFERTSLVSRLSINSGKALTEPKGVNETIFMH